MQTRARQRLLLFIATLGVCVLGINTSPAMAVAPTSTPVHALLIKSNEAVQIASEDQKEWYERGIWPVVGAIAALILTNAVAVGVVYLQSSRSFNAILKQRKIEALATSLSEFYNPLLALLDINREIFSKTGPPSFPAQDPARSAAAMIWRETKKKVLANNVQIETILRTKTHLIQGPDSLDRYHRLLVHVAMYETFQTVETDIYSNFQFPSDIWAHVETQRQLVLEAFNQVSGETI